MRSWRIKVCFDGNGMQRRLRVPVLFEERLLKLKSACPRTIQNAAAYSVAGGASTVDAREKE
jgi:hypothetical protein